MEKRKPHGIAILGHVLWIIASVALFGGFSSAIWHLINGHTPLLMWQKFSLVMTGVVVAGIVGYFITKRWYKKHQ